MGAYDQSMLQYQHHPRYQSQVQPQQSPAANQSYNKDQSLDPVQRSQNSPHPYGVFGLVNMRKDPYLSLLGSGIDLSALGMNVTSSDNLYETFSSPWSDDRSKGDPKYSIPPCYYAMHPPLLHQGFFARFQLLTLFYIFYSMPRDAAQIYAAHELYKRGWFYHKEMKLWLSRIQNSEPTVKTNTYERGSYRAFDPVNFESHIKDNVVIYYEAVEKQPALPQH